MSRFYTRKGDNGTTGLLGEGRVLKSDPRMETLGALDEASAALGLARSLMNSAQNAALVIQLQQDLYHLMAEVSATVDTVERFRVIDAGRVQWLEAQTDEIGRGISLPNEFIVPGDTPSAAAISLARTVVRRAERRLVQLFTDGLFDNESGLAYLNRLSSLCFVLELSEVKAGGKGTPTLAKED